MSHDFILVPCDARGAFFELALSVVIVGSNPLWFMSLFMFVSTFNIERKRVPAISHWKRKVIRP
jgi:hypothetical protein